MLQIIVIFKAFEMFITFVTKLKNVYHANIEHRFNSQRLKERILRFNLKKNSKAALSTNP